MHRTAVDAVPGGGRIGMHPPRRPRQVHGHGRRVGGTARPQRLPRRRARSPRRQWEAQERPVHARQVERDDIPNTPPEVVVGGQVSKIKTPKGVHGHTRAAPAPPPAKAGAAGGLPAPPPNPPWKSPSARWGSKVPRGAKSRRAEGRERLSWLSSGVVGSSPPPLERGRTCARATYGRVCDAGEAERQPPWGRAKGPYTTR